MWVGGGDALGLALVDPAPSPPPVDSPDLSTQRRETPPFAARVVALVEVLICSDFLTQTTPS
jgi:hypothetical protein